VHNRSKISDVTRLNGALNCACPLDDPDTRYHNYLALGSNLSQANTAGWLSLVMDLVPSFVLELWLHRGKSDQAPRLERATWAQDSGLSGLHTPGRDIVV